MEVMTSAGRLFSISWRLRGGNATSFGTNVFALSSFLCTKTPQFIQSVQLRHWGNLAPEYSCRAYRIGTYHVHFVNPCCLRLWFALNDAGRQQQHAL